MADNHDDPAHDPDHVPDIACDLDADKINEQANIRLKRDGTPASPHYKADNSGGHGNPPVSGQFQRNNKRGGRKKKDRSMEAALQRIGGPGFIGERIDGTIPTQLPALRRIVPGQKIGWRLAVPCRGARP